MTEIGTPERIWASPEHDDEGWNYGGFWISPKVAPSVEYVRADTIEAITAERDRLREALRIIKYSGKDGTQDQIAPEMWEFCIDTADDALGTLKEPAE